MFFHSVDLSIYEYIKFANNSNFNRFITAPVISFAFTKLVDFKDGKLCKFLVCIALIGIIIFSGKLVYNSDNFQKVGNWYKIPDNILTVLLASGDLELDNKKVMCPLNVIAWVRQVDSILSVVYGRPVAEIPKMIQDYGNGNIKSYMKYFMDKKCNIIILEKNVTYDTNIEDYGYELFFENAEYFVYKIEF